MEDIFVTLTNDLPTGANGIVAMDANGDYIVAINARLCPAKQQAVLEHELSHIRHGDLAQRHRIPAHVIERERRK